MNSKRNTKKNYYPPIIHLHLSESDHPLLESSYNSPSTDTGNATFVPIEVEDGLWGTGW